MTEQLIRTVLGDIAPAELGRTDCHVHLLHESRLLPGEGLADVGGSHQEVREARAGGITALVELTPIGLGRDPVGLRRIALLTGVHVVMATGLHGDEHYDADHPVRELSADELGDRFAAEVAQAVNAADSGPPMEVDGVRAGVVTVGVGHWRIAPLERSALEAAGAAHRATGAPVVCRLDGGTAAWEVLALLADGDVPAGRVVLAHVDRNPDPGLHVELAAAGAVLSYDGWGRPERWPDSVLLDCLAAVAEAGHDRRLLIGGGLDRRSAFRSHGGLPGLRYLPDRVVPRLENLGLAQRVLVGNPAAVLALPALPARPTAADAPAAPAGGPPSPPA